MPKLAIRNITARQILDSRGIPTLEVAVETAKGVGVFGVPSGASTGSHEALELRDGGSKFLGLGVSKAVGHVNNILGRKIKGMNVFDQDKIDEAMRELDGTENKSRFGANAILGISGAVCKSAAASKKLPVYKYVSLLSKNKKVALPRPMFNVVNGGAHGATNLDIQEFMLVPKGNTMAENVRMGVEVFQTLKNVLKLHQLDTDLGNEGGYSPDWESNEQAFKLIMEAVKKDGVMGQIELAIDAAASEFLSKDKQQYILKADRTSLTSERLVSLYNQWVNEFPLISIEDGLAEEDWEGWNIMQQRLGSKILIVGDDLTVTQAHRLQEAIKRKIANAIIIKPNQVGTISETLETIKLARDNKYKVIASHRSGETNDDFIADFAVGISADFIKAGSVARGERVAKYNRLMQIETKII